MKTRRVVVVIKQNDSKDGEYELTFSYPETNIGFNVSQTENEKPEKCVITVSGVSHETYMIFDSKANRSYQKNQRADVYFGYDSDLSLVFSGTIDRVRYEFANGDQKMHFAVSRNMRKFNKQIKNVSLSGKKTLREALEAICSEYGYKAIMKDESFNFIEIGRYSDSTTIEQAIKQVLPTDFGNYTSEDEIFFYHKDKSVPHEIILYGENGLLTYPVEDSSGEATTIKSVLLPFCKAGMKVKVPIDELWFSNLDTGTYKEYVVKNFSSSFSNGEGVTNMECAGGVDF
ncbi:MAG: hypothetical protein ACRC0G_01660 [Fusobacteriaceae bacterium]